MKRKKILIGLIIFTILFVIITFAIIKISVNAEALKTPVEDEISDIEYNEKRKKKKEEWLKNNKSDASTNLITESDTSLLGDELMNRYSQTDGELEEKANKMQEIINRFYREEYTQLSAELNENIDKMSYNEICKQEYTKKIFELIIDIIKNKDITVEEENILKDFLDEQYFFIKDDSSMKLKFDEVLADYQGI